MNIQLTKHYVLRVVHLIHWKCLQSYLAFTLWTQLRQISTQQYATSTELDVANDYLRDQTSTIVAPFADSLLTPHSVRVPLQPAKVTLVGT